MFGETRLTFYKPIMKRIICLLALFGLFFTGISVAQQSEPKVTIVKYSDYQCPGCKYFVSIEKQLKEEYGEDIEIITKHFPLRMHEYAQLSARAVEAAREQGKHHEMHDLIFDGQEHWARGNAEGIFIGYARSLNLDMDKFRADLNSAAIQRRVMEDKNEGLDLGVNATPTFFINGHKIPQNPPTYAAFKAIVEQFMN